MNNINENTLKTLNILTAPFDLSELETRQARGGRNLHYVPVNKCIERANAAWDTRWSFEILKYEITMNHIIVHGRVTSPEGSCKDTVYAEPITVRKNSGEIVSLGDDMKSAGSYAMRKCLWQFGIGLYLSDESHPDHPRNQRRNSEGRSRGQKTDSAHRTLPTANCQPASDSTRPNLRIVSFDYKKEFFGLIEKYGNGTKVDPEKRKSWIKEETGHNEDDLSNEGWKIAYEKFLEQIKATHAKKSQG